MIIFTQQVHVTYKGKDLASFPVSYPWWRRLWAFLTQEHLPEEKLVDETTVRFTIQGPDLQFVEKEAAYRIKACLEKYQRHCPEAVVDHVVHGAIHEYNRPRPLRDFSPSKSRDFDAWAASFS